MPFRLAKRDELTSFQRVSELYFIENKAQMVSIFLYTQKKVAKQNE